MYHIHIVCVCDIVVLALSSWLLFHSLLLPSRIACQSSHKSIKSHRNTTPQTSSHSSPTPQCTGLVQLKGGHCGSCLCTHTSVPASASSPGGNCTVEFGWWMSAGELIEVLYLQLLFIYFFCVCVCVCVCVLLYGERGPGRY